MDEDLPTLHAYRAAISRLTDAMDRMLARGEAARERDRALQHRAQAFAPLIPPLSSRPPEVQQTHRAIETLTVNLYRRFLGPTEPAHPSPTPAAAARVLQSHHRI